jgi:hypothetical protein
MHFMAHPDLPVLVLLALAGWFTGVSRYPFYYCLCNLILLGIPHLRQVFIARTHRLCGRTRRRYWRVAQADGTPHRSRAKPDWAKREVLRMKALMPHSGCRKIADCFNRRFELARRTTVGKSYVSDTLRKHHYEIAILRRKIKSTKPKAVPHNLIWALDLTGKTTLDGRTCLVLAIIEHASRAALALEALHDKSSWTLVGKLAAAIRCYGKPRFVRTDNERVFTSRVFELALFLLGIRHQKATFIARGKTGAWSVSSVR